MSINLSNPEKLEVVFVSRQLVIFRTRNLPFGLKFNVFNSVLSEILGPFYDKTDNHQDTRNRLKYFKICKRSQIPGGF